MISQADLEEFLGIAADTDTSLLTELEAAAVEWFEQQTQRYFGAAGAVEVVLNGSGKRELYLPEPITSVTSVKKQAYPGATQETITDSDDDGFVIRDMHLARKGGYAWTAGYEYVVTYTRGYTENDAGPPADIAAPDDVRMAIKQIVAFWYNAGAPADGVGGKISETIGDYSYSRGGVYQNEAAMLNAIPGLRQVIASYYLPRF